MEQKETLSLVADIRKTLEQSKNIGNKINLDQNSDSIPSDDTLEAVEPETDIVPEIEVKNEPEIKQPEIKQPEIKQPAKKISLFDSVKQSTEEDLQKGKDIKKAMTSLAGKDDISDDELFGDNDPKMNKELADVKASGIVEFADLIFMLIAMFISGDWSQDGQDKFSMSDKRKRVLKVLIMRQMLARKQKVNPTGSIILVAVTSCVPVIIIAIWERVAKNRAKNKQTAEISELDKKLAELRSMQEAQYLETENGNRIKYVPFNEVKNEVKQEIVKPVTPPIINDLSKPEKPVNGKKGKVGRHKKTCVWHEDKNKCNCGKW
jgi:hypothetical protein